MRFVLSLTILLAACTQTPTQTATRTQTPTPTPTQDFASSRSELRPDTPDLAPSASLPDARTPTDPPIPSHLLSPPLRNTALRSPMPGGWIGGWYGDTGVDISGRYLSVHAIAAGTLEYSEWGHTLWTGKGDTPYSVRIRLDAPIPLENGHRVTHVYYTHLSEIVTQQPEASEKKKHVVAGERIGTSGIGNHVAHLHLGLLLDNQVEQDSWEFILREDAVRKVMGGYKNGTLLPPMPQGSESAGVTSSSAPAPSPRRGS